MTRSGKASPAVLDRCVVRPLKKLEQAQQKQACGEEGAFSRSGCRAAFSGNVVTACISGGVGEWLDPSVEMYLAGLMNRLLAKGADPRELSVCVMFPGEGPEALLKELIERICDFARKYDLHISDVDARSNEGILSAQIALTMLGCRKSGDPDVKEAQAAQGKILQDCDLVMTESAGRAGTAVLAFCFEEELRKRFPLFLMQDAIRLGEDLVCMEAVRLARKYDVQGMREIGEGGVFAALWELGETFGAGLDLDLKKIPIRQETIEICEQLDLNPYQLYGQGSMLILVPDGETLVSRMEKEGLPAAVIGRTTSLKSRILRNGEEIRYLEKPQQDMLFRLRDHKKMLT